MVLFLRKLVEVLFLLRGLEYADRWRVGQTVSDETLRHIRRNLRS